MAEIEFSKSAWVRNEFPPKSEELKTHMRIMHQGKEREGCQACADLRRAYIADIDEHCRESELPGRLEVNYAGNGGVTAIVFHERHPVQVEGA